MKLVALKEKCPHRASGRHVVLADAVQQAKALAGGGQLSLAVRESVMREHAAAYNMLSPREQQQYDEAASRTARKRAADPEDEARHVE
eukprot:345998-Lingulodinium_polyedra.AAC.1